MRVRRSVAAVLAVSALAGCGSGTGSDRDRSEPRSSQDTQSAATAEPTRTEAPSGRALAEMLAELDTGRTTARLDIDGTTITRTGSYRISGSASTTETTYDLGEDGTLVTRALSIGGNSFSQVDNGNEMQMERCWLRNESVVSGIAPEIGVLLDVREEQGRATADLYTVASMLSAQFLTALGVTLDSTARTPIDLRVDEDGTVTGWSTTFERLVESVEEAGLEPSTPLVGFANGPIDVELDGLGDPVDIVRPAEDRQVPIDPNDPATIDEAEFEDALRACEAG